MNLSNCSKFHKFIAITVITFLTIGQTNSDYLLDNTYPLIITAESEPFSHFGLTVSLSKGPVPSSLHERPTGWVFIGAPTAKVPKLGKTTGAMWRCSLGRGVELITTLDTCEIVNIDPKPSGGGRGKGSPAKEDEGDSWIGSSLMIKNERLILCGPRYTRGERHFMNGICYWLSEDVKNFPSFRPDLPIDIKNYYHRLIPFFNSSASKQGGVFNFTNLRNQPDTGYEYGVGQFGFSAHILQNETGGTDLLVGAPSVREWAGAVVRYRDNPSNAKDKNLRKNRNPTDPTFSEFVIAHRGTKLQDKNNHWYNYFGYGVTSGRFFDTGEVFYAAGAPRGNALSGEVVIFKIQTDGNDYIGEIKEALPPLSPTNAIIRPASNNNSSDGVGWYFGSVLHAVDLNDDGRDELLVAAPMCTLKVSKKQNLNEFEGDNGCVFLFSFSSSNSTKVANHDQTLCGKPTSRFGSAISHISWKNLLTDKTETYVVIGAPFENNGAIYIYKADSGRQPLTLFQEIFALDLQSSLRGFGSSLSLPEDVDENGTPDLAIGAFLSSQVVIFRTRVKVTFNGTILSYEKGDYPRNAQDIRFQSCIFMNTESGTVKSETVFKDVWVHIKIDYRLRIDKADNMIIGEDNSTLTYKQSVLPNKEKCQTIQAQIKNPVEFIDNDTSPEPFKFVQIIWYNTTSQIPGKIATVEYKISSENKKVKTVNTPESPNFRSFETLHPYPVLPTERTFLLNISPNDCDDSTACVPSISIPSANFYYVEDINRTSPITEVTLGNVTEIVFLMVIYNDGELAPQPTKLDFTLDSDVEIVPGAESQNFLRSDKCKNGPKIETKTAFNCIINRNIKGKSKKTVEFRLSLKNSFAKQTNTTLELKLSPRVTPLIGHPVSEQTKIALLVKSKIVMHGTRLNETLRNPFTCKNTIPFHSIENEDKFCGTVGSSGDGNSQIFYEKWRQTYTVQILGTSGVDNIAVKILLPRGEKGSVKNTSLISTRYDNHGKTNVVCQMSLDHTGSPDLWSLNGNRETSTGNGENVTPKPQRRRRRDANNNVKKEHFAVNEDMLQIGCNDENGNNPTFVCSEVVCSISKLSANKPVEISFDFFLVKDKIDELLERFGKKGILIETKGEASMLDGKDDFKDQDVAQSRIVRYEVVPVATWVYVVSILSGLTLLILIVIALYQCGFFKREVKQQLQAMRQTEARKSMMVSEYTEEEHEKRKSVFSAGGRMQEINLNEEQEDLIQR